MGRARPDRTGPATITEVAARAGVSTATVSRVVSGRGRVRPDTRARVEQAIAVTGWAADPAARQLAGGPGDEVVLAVAVADRSDFAADPHYARVIAGAQGEATRHGLSLSVHVTALGELPDLAPFAGGGRYRGAILVNASADEAAVVGSLRRPVVCMGTATRAVPSVSPDNEGGALRAVEHLITGGRRRVATIAGPERNPCARARLDGYHSGMRAAGLRPVVVSADFTRADAALATRRLLRRAPGLDAVFVASDLMATAVLQVLQASGRDVPSDVAVVGFDDSPPAWMTSPALSTVHQPVEQLAALAVRALAVPDYEPAPDRVLPTRLIARASSAA